ncbi:MULTISPECIES: FAD-binding oxidoreductase [unclassified Mesorhizobium]|uniref:FAD-binding oxidoreductase n=1 Tax=Mesorhizobium sp. TaxID=1871066 RepID=UPI0003CFBF9D|nr:MULTISPECIES: FAD-binding oxidoreductase [unclassified Mesorhizobium]ESZ19290.1 oxidoreductase [Mesorhizobium sp. L48C026A00]RWN54211.1 MAG: FAD-binding oxidoreductase [Mesorhizobium sp.]RWN79313.1 MAG: FAD-binding oxidoreductase [Mesorhizobium sp.]RWN84870.1 MAG: FAD-binding oxidoreductase [Mesorhizobium sp.]RWN92989.1 MAG: FAD-binding oxidoreductase [Mesorhizobium sp.]
MDKPVTSHDFPDRLLASVIDQNHPAYEEARGLYNAMIDKRPRWIMPCAEVADVVAAVNHAREKQLLLAIRGGGHSGPGFGSCDGGMVIDMSPMNRVDIDLGTSTVRVEAGCTQGDVDRATSAHGLAVPAGLVSSTGIAGLTLGGGTGHLTRKHGLTIDNLLAAEVVLADGSVVTASENEHPELFWALRGGGGNFGVVTRFTFQAHPAKDVYAGPIFFDIAHAAEIMRWYRDFLPGAQRELGMFFGIKTVPSCDPFPREIWGRRVCALISCYNGAEEDGVRAMRPVRDALPRPLMDGMMQMPFVDLQALFDPLLPKGLQWYWKGDYVDELSDAAIAAHAEHGSKTPSELSLMHLYPIDGAAQEVAPDATAWGARRARWSMVIAGIDPDPTKAPALRRWASEYWAAVHKHNPHGGAYINFMMDDEGEARVRAAYGANYERLVAAKRQYDPANLFRVNHNIRP